MRTITVCSFLLIYIKLCFNGIFSSIFLCLTAIFLIQSYVKYVLFKKLKKMFPPCNLLLFLLILRFKFYLGTKLESKGLLKT